LVIGVRDAGDQTRPDFVVLLVPVLDEDDDYIRTARWLGATKHDVEPGWRGK
jgi:hypothetical protein